MRFLLRIGSVSRGPWGVPLSKGVWVLEGRGSSGFPVFREGFRLSVDDPLVYGRPLVNVFVVEGQAVLAFRQMGLQYAFQSAFGDPCRGPSVRAHQLEGIQFHLYRLQTFRDPLSVFCTADFAYSVVLLHFYRVFLE